MEVVDFAMGGQSIGYMKCYLRQYIARKPPVVMRLSVQFFTFLFSLNLLLPSQVVSQTNFYEDPRFPAIANSHEVIAVLPFISMGIFLVTWLTSVFCMSPGVETNDLEFAL